LDCANCAAKIEARIQAMPEVEAANLVFAARQLRVTAGSHEGLLEKMQEQADAVEDGVKLTPREEKRPVPKAHASEEPKEQKKELVAILLGAALFVAGEVMELLGAPLPALLAALVPAYLILGGEVLMTALKNMVKGQVFDENFLMCLATLGAFAIGEYPEAVGVMLFYRIGEYFEERAVERSRSQIMSAVDLRPETVNLTQGDEIHTIPAEQAQVGDILLVRPGDRIPLDGVIVEGESRIDTSPVTGEPVPVGVGPGSSVISGCVNTSGQLKMQVEKPLSESMVTRILDSVENAAANKPAIDKFITRFARIYTPAVVLGALFVALVLPCILPGWHFFVDEVKYAGLDSILFGQTGTASVFTALTFLVISCPCALVLSVPLAFFSGIGAASKKGILFKGGNSIEALAQIKAVVMDKTGTITKGDFRVQRVKNVLAAENMDAQRELLWLCASCEQRSTHPIAVSIVAEAREQGLTLAQPQELEELPGRGIRATVEGTEVLCGNARLMRENDVDFDECDEYGTRVLVAVNGVYQGYLLIADTIKPGAEQAVQKLRSSGIQTVMLTGDAEKAARAVAETVGIDRVHAKLLPEEKLERLQAIRNETGRVMFVGDGINDAPVLAGADVGAAMGSGADAAIEAADVVFMNSDVSAIPESVEIARATRRISWENVYFALAVKLIVMVLGLCGYANMWFAVFADTGVSMLCLLNSIRILYRK
ncbi:MAG: heavy metal translocating P-type ATPase, partial [Faecousia sp.]